VLEKEIEGNSMEPLLPNGTKILLQIWYYQGRNLPERGDIIAYNYGGNEHPIIKVVRGLPGDATEIDPIRKTIKINGEYLTNSIGTLFSFTDGELRLMWLYTKSGYLPAEGYLIFGDNVRDSIDSRKFGAVSKYDFYGKFIPKP
jgi:signal peptidase I